MQNKWVVKIILELLILMPQLFAKRLRADTGADSIADEPAVQTEKAKSSDLSQNIADGVTVPKLGRFQRNSDNRCFISDW